jgi:hypothetical protein
MKVTLRAGNGGRRMAVYVCALLAQRTICAPVEPTPDDLS